MLAIVLALISKQQTKKHTTTASNQHMVFQAIYILKKDLQAKIEEKAVAQSAELQSQVDQLQVELQSPSKMDENMANI